MSEYKEIADRYALKANWLAESNNDKLLEDTYIDVSSDFKAIDT